MSELKVEMMNRKQLQDMYNKHYREAHPRGPTPEQSDFLSRAQKNPNWKHIKAPYERKEQGVY